MQDIKNETFSDWGTVISGVNEKLPSVESDSEASTLTDDSESEHYIFQRSIYDQPTSNKQDNCFTNLEKCNSLKEQHPLEPRSLLFQRLKCKAPLRSDATLSDDEFPLYEENGEGIAENTEIEEASTETRFTATEKFCLSEEDNDIVPVLSLKDLESYDLDDVLDKFSDQNGNTFLENHCTGKLGSDLYTNPLMDQLICLSGLQGTFSHRKEATVVIKSKESTLVKQEDKILSDVTSSLKELSYSEPTTVFLDLRSSSSDAMSNKAQVPTTSSRGISTDKSNASSFRSTFLCKHHNESDDSEDEFEQWKELRKRFKTNFLHHNEILSGKEDSPSINRTQARKKGLSCKSAKFNVNNDEEHNLDKDLLKNKIVDKVHTLKSKHFCNQPTQKETFKNSFKNPKFNNEPRFMSTNGDINKTGIYASQRLKQEKTPVSKEMQCLTPPTGRNLDVKESGKTTVLFAEEPQKSIEDSTHIYRNKQLLKLESTEATSMAIQTDESFSTSFDRKDIAQYVNTMLSCSTKDLTVAAKKVAEEKKQNLEHENKIENLTSMNGAKDTTFSILRNQRNQPPMTKMDDLIMNKTTDIKIPFKRRHEVSKLLNKVFQDTTSPVEKRMFPYLYDSEATFSSHINSVPFNVEKKCPQKLLLLSFQMTSPGSIIYTRLNARHRFNPIDSGTSLSLTYPLLLSWLFALIPDKVEKPHDPPREDIFTFDCDNDQEPDNDMKHAHCDGDISRLVEVPFNVVSMHQVWQEETQTIATNIVVVPNFFYKPDNNGRRKKPKKENAFYQVVWNFLQSNRIQDVCPWHARPESPIYTLNEVSLSCCTKPLSTFMTVSNDPKLLHKALNRKCGFFWKLVSPDEQNVFMASLENSQLENTICLLQKESFTYPLCLMDLVMRLQLSCLDVVGLRLTYVTRRFVQNNALSNYGCDLDETVPCVALVVRGKSAIKKMLHIIGPRDPVLARITDQGSLNAVYGDQLLKRKRKKETHELNAFNCPRSQDRVQQQLAVWFGGRIDVTDDMLLSALSTNNENHSRSMRNQSCGKYNMQNAHLYSKNETNPMSGISSSSYLTTFYPSCVCLVISSRFPPQFLGDILTIAAEQGFSIEGVKRMHLNERKVVGLGISSRYVVYFHPNGTIQQSLEEEYYEIDNWWQRPATIMLLSRENAHIHQAGLISCIQSELIFRLVSSQERGHLTSVTSQCFHICMFQDTVHHLLGPICKFPDAEFGRILSPQSFFVDPEFEQIVVLTLLGKGIIRESGCILQTLLHGEFTLQPGENLNCVTTDDQEEEYSSEFRGFEMLGIKYIPCLSFNYAKELTPFEIGTDLWSKSLTHLKDNPVLLCVLRRVNAFQIISSVLKMDNHQQHSQQYLENCDRLLSKTPEMAYRQVKMFFNDKELFADNRCRPLLKYLPPPFGLYQCTNSEIVKSEEEDGGGDQTYLSNIVSKPKKMKKKKRQKEKVCLVHQAEGCIFDTMLDHPQPLTSVLIIKPDAFPRHVVKILRCAYQEGFVVVAAHMTILSEDQASHIMPSKYNKMLGERNIFISHMTSAASLVLCVLRRNAIRRLLDVAGPDVPYKTHTYISGQNANWRAEFGIDEFSNAIHVSESYVSSCEEQKLFFPNGLCCTQTVQLKMEQIPTPAQDSVMSEENMKGREVRVCTDPTVDLFGASGMDIQSVCVIITSTLILKPSKLSTVTPKPPHFVEILDQLLTQGYELCAWRMSYLQQSQAQKVSQMMGEKSPTKLKSMIKLLTQEPCFVLLMQRENGLILFDSILGSKSYKSSNVQDFNPILRTQTVSQTKMCIQYLFNRVENRRSVITIGHKRALEWKGHNGT